MTRRYHQMCWGVKQLDAVNELTSLFAPRSDAGYSLMIDIRSSAKILTYNNVQAYCTATSPFT